MLEAIADKFKYALHCSSSSEPVQSSQRIHEARSIASYLSGYTLKTTVFVKL